MDGRAERRLQVVEKTELTPHMLRIVLGGSELLTFPNGMEGGYVKLYFPTDSTSPKKPTMRSYTIRQFDQKTLRLTLDIATHGDNGPASSWAINAEVGDYIISNGPGAVKLINISADWFFIAGDMSALPAICVNVESLPANARGYVVIEIVSELDKQIINVPPGIELHWVINPHPEVINTYLLDAVKTLPWHEGQVEVWAACEFDTMRNLRNYFKKERAVERDHIYISSYWKIGETDEGNKLAKKMDVDEL